MGFGSPEPEPMLKTFREILAQRADDGGHVRRRNFTRGSHSRGTGIWWAQAEVVASISGARITLTIDIGFGDALEPGAEVLDYPSMLGFPMHRLRAYARETVIAEKFQAMVMLGRANSRMKDFYEIWILSRSFDFNDDRLARAITATFERRDTPIPTEVPDALTDAFAKDEEKQRQWHAFIESVAHEPGNLTDVIAEIATFLMPHAVGLLGWANEVSSPRRAVERLQIDCADEVITGSAVRISSTAAGCDRSLIPVMQALSGGVFQCAQARACPDAAGGLGARPFRTNIRCDPPISQCSSMWKIHRADPIFSELLNLLEISNIRDFSREFGEGFT
nr:nucleotidyl transferase AbiEii/AbiGii toxin family protein [Rhizobium hidalgonense]